LVIEILFHTEIYTAKVEVNGFSANIVFGKHFVLW